MHDEYRFREKREPIQFLNNFVLEANGLKEQWNNGVPSDWEGELGRHSPRDVNAFLPPALLRALRPDQMSEYATSGMGPGNDHEANMDIEPDPDLGDNPVRGDKTTRIVRHLSLNYFCKKLVEHFPFISAKRVWPSHFNVVQPRISAP